MNNVMSAYWMPPVFSFNDLHTPPEGIDYACAVDQSRRDEGMCFFVFRDGAWERPSVMVGLVSSDDETETLKAALRTLINDLELSSLLDGGYTWPSLEAARALIEE